MLSFVHRPATPGTGRIRLVQLLPTPAVAPSNEHQHRHYHDTVTNHFDVRCTLIHTSLDDHPPYVALSYAWGDATRSSPILVNDAVYYATKSLAVMLASLAPKDDNDKPFVAWVDALCIDQDDEEEKTAQVQQMARVYSQATEVICWLGTAADQSDEAMLWMQKFGAEAYRLGIGETPSMRLINLLRQDPQSIVEESVRRFIAEIVNQFTSWNPKGHSPVSGLFHLFARSYWSRMWIVQEIMLGKSARFVCGNMSVEEDQLHHTLRLIRNFGHYQALEASRAAVLATRDKTINASKDLSVIQTMNPINLLKLRRARGPYELVYLIRSLRHFQATDPRDRIFSLLSFASDAPELDVRPNYAMSYTEIYLSVTKALIARGYLEVLSLCTGPDIDETPGLPSWVPDLSKPRTRAALQQRALVRKAKPLRSILQPSYSTSRREKAKCTFHEDNATGTVCLTVEAVHIGQVQGVGRVWESSNSKTDHAAEWLDNLDSMSQTMFKEDRLARLKAIFRTAVADQEGRSGEAKPRLSPALVEKLVTELGDRRLSEVSRQVFNEVGMADYGFQMYLIAQDRRPFSVEGKLLGIGPAQVQPGDEVYVIIGADVPFILRKTNDAGLKIIGEAYVHDIMDGEALDGTRERMTITIA